MTVPADYFHVYMCVPRKYPQTCIKLPRAPFCSQHQRPWHKTVYSTEEEAELPQEASWLTCRKRCYCCQVRVS